MLGYRAEGGVVVAGEVVLVVAEVVGGEWENISHRLLILPSPISPPQCSTCQPFAVSLYQSGILHKTQTNTHRVSKSLLFYDKIDEIDIDDNIIIVKGIHFLYLYNLSNLYF